MTLLARGHLGRRGPGPGAPPSSGGGKSHARWHRVPVMGHGQGIGWGCGQNGLRSSKKSKTGICAQPTMS
jgi:hypothetical protein